MGKRGPVAEWARDRNREKVIGLRERKDDRFYTITPEGQHKTFGRDRDDAIRRFRVWQSNETKATICIESDIRTLPRELIDPVIVEKRRFVRNDVSEAAYWDRVRYDLTEHI